MQNAINNCKIQSALAKCKMQSQNVKFDQQSVIVKSNMTKVHFLQIIWKTWLHRWREPMGLVLSILGETLSSPLSSLPVASLVQSRDPKSVALVVAIFVSVPTVSAPKPLFTALHCWCFMWLRGRVVNGSQVLGQKFPTKDWRWSWPLFHWIILRLRVVEHRRGYYAGDGHNH